ncbi:cyclic nucleotide-gated cation channel alpha-3-like isoform X2 [Haliotis rufescens]|uniref:cyclic nucleotide-gated cation channel alpha-3-like isoform X2 n=1 Tax=Haliotis rufescens TaxID=6454 RepID=UPI00201EF626|nr:cyclic nucleotide-gated cation channel alpha-3-like isoform X2 [Haliotis rufescens]
MPQSWQIGERGKRFKTFTRRNDSQENGVTRDSPEDEEEEVPLPSRPHDKWRPILLREGSTMTMSRSRDEPDQSEMPPNSTSADGSPDSPKDDKKVINPIPVDPTPEDLVLDPNGKWAYYWMGVVASAVMYNCAVIILRVAFRELREHSVYQRIFSTLDNIGDVIYLIDIGVQARTAFLLDGCLVRDPEQLFRHYRGKTRFLLDVSAILPFTTAYGMLTGVLQLLPFNVIFHDATHMAAPIMRIARLLKYHTLANFFQATDSHTSNPNLLRAFKLSVHLWMVIHWIGCIYYMASEYEGLGSNEWVYPDGEEYSALARKYIRCTYWSTMTLTTIGERPSPITDLEYVFTGLTFLIGVFVFAAVVGNVGDVISNIHAARQDFQARMDQIKFYMQHRHVPEHLQDRVKKWADYTWNRTKAIDEPSVLQLLPERLRTEIAIHVHLETLKKVKIFEECEEGLLRELVLKLRPQIYSPGDYICRIGEIGREMYILNHGRVEILVPSAVAGQRTQVAILTPGNYFGEISLLKLDDGQNRRTADVRAIGYSELLCLSRRDLLSALVEYPNAKEILEAQAKERMMQTKGVQKSDAGTRRANTTPKRRARDIFADVMRQEGFAKLISARGQEMSELHKVIGDMKTVLTQVSQCNSKAKCQCEEYQRRLRQKDKCLKKATRRVTELETVLRIRRSSSLPVSVRDHVTRQDSTQSDDSYASRGQEFTCQCLHDVRECNNGVMSPLKTRGSQDILYLGRRASRGTSFGDGYHRCLLNQDSVSSSSSQSHSMDLLSAEAHLHECNTDSVKNGNFHTCARENNSNGSSSLSHPANQEPLPPPIDQYFLEELDAVFGDSSLLSVSESGLILSDVSSNSDNSSIDDIDDL